MTDQIYNIDGWTAERINTARKAGQLTDLMAGIPQPTNNDGDDN